MPRPGSQPRRCRYCGVELREGENWGQGDVQMKNRICTSCVDIEREKMRITSRKMQAVCSCFTPENVEECARRALRSTLVLPLDLASIMRGEADQANDLDGKAPEAEGGGKGEGKNKSRRVRRRKKKKPSDDGPVNDF